jgi:hypothetical protein
MIHDEVMERTWRLFLRQWHVRSVVSPLSRLTAIHLYVRKSMVYILVTLSFFHSLQNAVYSSQVVMSNRPSHRHKVMLRAMQSIN